MSGASEEYEDDCDDDGYWGKHLLVYGRQCIGWVRVALIFFFFLRRSGSSFDATCSCSLLKSKEVR